MEITQYKGKGCCRGCKWDTGIEGINEGIKCGPMGMYCDGEGREEDSCGKDCEMCDKWEGVE